MSIQRWSLAEFGTLNGSQYTMHPFGNGAYVLHADHVAALRACEDRVLNEYRKQHDGISERYFQQIRNDALDAATEAVAALDRQRVMATGPDGLPLAADYVARKDALSAIAAVRGGSASDVFPLDDYIPRTRGTEDGDE